MSTKLLRQIKNSLPDLRKSEKVVGEFILKDPKSIITMKTAEASEAMGISEPTLIRFCKAIGFSGFQELKINLSQQLAADDYFVMYEIKEEDSIHELCEKVFDTTISEILNVRSQIDQNILSKELHVFKVNNLKYSNRWGTKNWYGNLIEPSVEIVIFSKSNADIELIIEGDNGESIKENHTLEYGLNFINHNLLNNDKNKYLPKGKYKLKVTNLEESSFAEFEIN